MTRHRLSKIGRRHWGRCPWHLCRGGSQSRPFDNGNIVQLKAQYEVIGQDAAHSFVAHIEGKQNNETQEAVFNGTIIEGWLLGALVHVTYDRIAPCPAFGKAVCFTGVIRIMPGSAS